MALRFLGGKVNVSAIGTGIPLVVEAGGNELGDRTLVAGSNISLTYDPAQGVIIAATGTITGTIHGSARGTGVDHIIVSGAEVAWKRLQGLNAITLTDTGNEIQIDSPNITHYDYGTGKSVVYQTTGHDIYFKTLGNSDDIEVLEVGTGSNTELQFSFKGIQASAVSNDVNPVLAVSGKEITFRTFGNSDNVNVSVSSNNVVKFHTEPGKLNFGLNVFNGGITTQVSGGLNNRTLVAEDGITFEIIDVGFNVGDGVVIYFEQANGAINAGTGVSLIPGNISNVSANTVYSVIKKSTGVFIVAGAT